ncbi:MAG TPA: aminotransferase class V-fold PLP-dependent enzyme [Candidatus Limnocylindrales bacterium]|nr:aminotransferase class V-fold PLP-dependent enzyme [Candidatus Limnocylindrales bacterium]
MTSGRPFLQIPGPTNVPERVLRAMDRAVIDHRGPELAALVRGLLPDLGRVFGSERGRVVVFPTSGTGAWEAALVNTLAPGDRVLSFEQGHFADLFARAARNLGLRVDQVPMDPRRPIPAERVEEALQREGRDGYRAVLVVHNETSTGVRNDVAAVRAALDAVGHEALLIVDTVSSLASMDFRADEWKVDVALTGSQKGLMLPPGLGILCAGPRALAASELGGSPRSFFDWRPVLRENEAGYFPYTPATLLLFGLRAALDILFEEGLEAVFARHERLAGAVRAAVRAWGLETYSADPAGHSQSLTAVLTPEGLDSAQVIRRARERFGLALGVGLGAVRGKLFRIGHLGSLNELETLAVIGGVEMALAECGVLVRLGAGAEAAEESLLARERSAARS